MEKQELILLTNSRGVSKEFPKKVAEKALLKAVAQETRKQVYWKLPDKSVLTLKAGHLVKAKA